MRKLQGLLPALLLLGTGLGLAWTGSAYKVGTLTAMGPGFMPVALGLCLVALAVVLLWQEKPVVQALVLPLRPVLCVSAGILAWVLLADRFGFFPSAFAQLLLSSLALPKQNWRIVMVVAVVLSLASYALFVLLLGLPLPAFGP